MNSTNKNNFSQKPKKNSKFKTFIKAVGYVILITEIEKILKEK